MVPILPNEIWKHIISHLSLPESPLNTFNARRRAQKHLYQASLVNSVFHECAAELLYQAPSIVDLLSYLTCPSRVPTTGVDPGGQEAPPRHDRLPSKLERIRSASSLHIHLVPPPTTPVKSRRVHTRSIHGGTSEASPALDAELRIPEDGDAHLYLIYSGSRLSLDIHPLPLVLWKWLLSLQRAAGLMAELAPDSPLFPLAQTVAISMEEGTAEMYNQSVGWRECHDWWFLYSLARHTRPTTWCEAGLPWFMSRGGLRAYNGPTTFQVPSNATNGYNELLRHTNLYGLNRDPEHFWRPGENNRVIVDTTSFPNILNSGHRPPQRRPIFLRALQQVGNSADKVTARPTGLEIYGLDTGSRLNNLSGTETRDDESLEEFYCRMMEEEGLAVLAETGFEHRVSLSVKPGAAAPMCPGCGKAG